MSTAHQDFCNTGKNPTYNAIARSSQSNTAVGLPATRPSLLISAVCKLLTAATAKCMGWGPLAMRVTTSSSSAMLLQGFSCFVVLSFLQESPPQMTSPSLCWMSGRV